MGRAEHGGSSIWRSLRVYYLRMRALSRGNWRSRSARSWELRRAAVAQADVELREAVEEALRRRTVAGLLARGEEHQDPDSFRSRGLNEINLVRMRGLEPPPGLPDTDLNRARLPIPPHPREWARAKISHARASALLARVQRKRQNGREHRLRQSVSGASSCRTRLRALW
jgi:hypothetical protein